MEIKTKINSLFKFKSIYFDLLLFFIFLIFSFKISSFNKLAIFGYIIVFVGAILWVIARYQLGDAFSILPKTQKIIQTGIYKKIRHPIYVSGILQFLGLCLVYQKIWFYVFLLFIVIMQTIRARAEEKILIKNFGQEYIEYKKSTWF